MARPRKPRRWLLWVLGACALVAVLAGVAYLVLQGRQQGDVSNPDVEFDTKPTTTQQQANRQPKSAKDPGFEWPLYGYDKQRTRYLPLRRPIHGPYRRVWSYNARALLEFPPVLSSRSLFLLKNTGALVAFSRRHGRFRWGRKLGTLAASSPAVAHGTVYVVLLRRSRGVDAGRVAALTAGRGRTRWSRKLPSRAESSPLLDRGTLYFGTESGTVYALRASTGAVKWTYHADGAVKGAIAMDAHGRLFFGDYAGKMYSLSAATGHRLWKVGTNGKRFGLGAGSFYSTPAVAYGRVYIGNTDGFVYSYAAASGKLAWRVRTGGYVYGSPAVASVPGGHPTVYVGSYDRRFYALDARSGRTRWVRDAGGRVSGGAVVIGDSVWFSTLENQTRALGARTGNLLYKIHRGRFNPVVSDGDRIYLAGASSLIALEPRHKQPAHRKRHRRRAHLPSRRFRLPKSAIVCFERNGHHVCRHRRPAVCFLHGGKLTCHAQRRRRHHYRIGERVCFRRHEHGRLVCHAKRGQRHRHRHRARRKR